MTTGDYQFSKPWGNQAAVQFDLYLGARAGFSNIVFPAMGNHECTGGTSSNCGANNADGVTQTYKSFLAKMLAPIGQTLPYYEIDVSAKDSSWTSKFVFIAANAWDAAQGVWLDSALSKKTTYTFVVRHESTLVSQAPGVSPSNKIIGAHPLTLLVVGHTHTFEHFQSNHEIVVGNGGAPLSSNVNYGYVIVRQRSDGAIEVKEHDYATNAVQVQFAIHPDGSVAP